MNRPAYDRMRGYVDPHDGWTPEAQVQEQPYPLASPSRTVTAGPLAYVDVMQAVVKSSQGGRNGVYGGREIVVAQLTDRLNAILAALPVSPTDAPASGQDRKLPINTEALDEFFGATSTEEPRA